MGARSQLLVHPVFTGAVALLAVNDQLLKTYVGGPVVGKLSDVAGVVLLAWALGVVTRRPAASSVVVALAFAALKTVPGVAELAAPVLGGTTLRDPTDLVALLALVPTTALLRRRLTADADLPRERAASLVALPAVGLAALAVTATSCAQPPVISDLRVNGDQVWVQQNGPVEQPGSTTTAPATTPTAGDGAPLPGTAPLPNPSRPPPERWERGSWAVSTDAGATWTEREPTEDPGGPPATRQACAPEIGCFRVDGGRRVEHRPREGDPWVTAFAFTREQERRLELRSDGQCSGDPDRFTLDRVVIAPTQAGPVVVVSANSEGLLRRAADGTWTRVAVMSCRPTTLGGPSWFADLALLPVLLIPFSIVLLVLAGVWRRWSWSTAAAVAFFGACGILLLAAILSAYDADYVGTGVVVALLTLVVFGISLRVGRAGEPDAPPSAVPRPGVPPSGAQPPPRS